MIELRTGDPPMQIFREHRGNHAIVVAVAINVGWVTADKSAGAARPTV